MGKLPKNLRLLRLQSMHHPMHGQHAGVLQHMKVFLDVPLPCNTLQQSNQSQTYHPPLSKELAAANRLVKQSGCLVLTS